MKVTRLYTGSDNKSHFEDIELKFGGDQKILTTESRPATMAVFRCVPPGTALDIHPAPRRQYLVTMSGSLGNRSEQRREKNFQSRRCDARRRHDRRGT